MLLYLLLLGGRPSMMAPPPFIRLSCKLRPRFDDDSPQKIRMDEWLAGWLAGCWLLWSNCGSTGLSRCRWICVAASCLPLVKIEREKKKGWVIELWLSIGTGCGNIDNNPCLKTYSFHCCFDFQTRQGSRWRSLLRAYKKSSKFPSQLRPSRSRMKGGVSSRNAAFSRV